MSLRYEGFSPFLLGVELEVPTIRLCLGLITSQTSFAIPGHEVRVAKRHKPVMRDSINQSCRFAIRDLYGDCPFDAFADHMEDDMITHHSAKLLSVKHQVALRGLVKPQRLSHGYSWITPVMSPSATYTARIDYLRDHIDHLGRCPNPPQ